MNGQGRKNTNTLCPTTARLVILFRATPPIARQASEASFFCDTGYTPLLWMAIGYCEERSGGVAAIACDTTGNTVQQGYCYTCLALGGGGLLRSGSLRCFKHEQFGGIWVRVESFRERRTHEHKQICGIVPGLGGCQKFMCVYRVIPGGGEKTHKQNSPKIPGQSRESFIYVFFSLCVSFAPKSRCLGLFW